MVKNFTSIEEFNVKEHLIRNKSAERAAQVGFAGTVYEGLRLALLEEGYRLKPGRIFYEKFEGRGPKGYSSRDEFKNFEQVYPVASSNSHRFLGLDAELEYNDKLAAVLSLRPQGKINLKISPESEIPENMFEKVWNEVISTVTKQTKK